MSNLPHAPVPQIRYALRLDRRFNTGEYELLKLGLQPKHMEDKWHIYLDKGGGILHFHRSWTGFCIFTVHLLADESGGWHTGAAWVNGDPEQYRVGTDTVKSEALLMWLIEFFLLKRDVPYPRPLG